MRILIISRGFPTEKYSLNGIFEYDQAKALAQAGNEVIFVAIDVRSIRRWRKWGFVNLDKDGVHIEALNIPCGRVPKLILNKIREIALRRLYSKVVAKYGKPDIIHSHFLEIGYASINALKEHEIPIVLTEHLSSMNQNELPAYLNRIGRLTYPQVSRVLTVSSLLSNSIIKNFKTENIVVPNIIDSSSFSYDKNKSKSDGFNFISTGGLIKRKGMDLLIKAFYDAFKNKVDVRLFIYGEGPERKNLENLINELKLSNQVFLMGLKDRKVIANKMKESHCFVLASKLETFGVVYIEAMATGLPVIATKCGGPEDFVNRDNGILISVNNQRQLSMAMQDMKNNIGIYNNEKISSEIRMKYSPESVASQLTDIYLELLNKKQSEVNQ
jgi:glycosyltransferase involved in cell wall biosynthesis